MANERKTLNIRALMQDDLTKELTGIKRSVAKLGETTKKANDKAAKSFNRLKKLVVALGAAYAAIKSIQLARSFVNDVDKIGKLANALGQPVERVSELAASFELAGGNAEQFSAVFASILSSVNGAVAGAGAQRDAFESLGLTISKLRTLNPTEILGELASGVEDVTDQNEKLRKFATLFPEQYRNVLNLVGQGREQFEKNLRDVRQAGATVTKEQAEQAAKVADAFTRVDKAVAGVGREILVAFGPALTNGLNAFALALTANKESIKNLALATLKAVRAVVVGAVEAIAFLVEKYESVSRLLGSAKSGITFGLADGLTAEQRASISELETQRKRWEDSLERITNRMYALRNAGRNTPDDKSWERATERAETYRRQLRRIEEQVREITRGGSGADVSTSSKLRSFAGELDRVIGELFSQDKNEQISNLFKKLGKDAGDQIGKGIKEGVKEATDDVGDKNSDVGVATERSAAANAQLFVKTWRDGIGRLKTEIRNFYETVGRGLANITTSQLAAFQSELANVITGAKTAKEAWKDFLNTSLQLLAKLIAKLATLKLIESVGGAVGYTFAKGGVMNGGGSGTGSAMPVNAYADGGIARRPQLALFGEGTRAEAFVPLPDNRSIPVTFTGANGPSGSGSVVNLNIYAWDSKDAARGLAENREVIMGLIQNGAEQRNGLRQTIQRAAR